MQEFILTVKYEKGEIQRAMLKVLLKRAKHWFPITLWIAGMLISYYGWRYCRLPATFMYIFIGLIPGIVLIVYFLASILALKEKRYKEGVTFHFSEEKVSWKGIDFKSEVEWSYFKKYVEDMVVFMLFIPRNQYLLLPKRVFDGKEQIKSFRELLQRKVKEAASSKMISKQVQKEDG